MNSCQVMFVTIFIVGTFVLSTEAQYRQVNVTVVLGDKGSSSQTGKLNLTLFANTVRYTYNLSSKFEDFDKNTNKTYKINSPVPLYSISQVAISWTKKIFTILDPKIHIRKVILNSSPYRQNYCTNKTDELVPQKKVVVLKPCK